MRAGGSSVSTAALPPSVWYGTAALRAIPQNWHVLAQPGLDFNFGFKIQDGQKLWPKAVAGISSLYLT